MHCLTDVNETSRLMLYVNRLAMKIIGLTGGIASGKSTVARLLAELGATVINADEVGHEVFKPETEAWREVIAAFGAEVKAEDGTIDRKKLGKIIFSDPQARERLNRIMHPRILQAIREKLEAYRQRGEKVVVIEAPLLLEAGWSILVDEVWVTSASEETILRRLISRSGLSELDALARIRAQMPLEERFKRAHVIIDTECSFSELKEKVKQLWQKHTEE